MTTPVAEARAAKAVEVLAKWQKSGHILLMAGEMTRQELRSVKAVAAGIQREVTATLLSDHPAPEPGVEAGEVAGGWLSAMTPPYAQEVEVRVGAMRFRAKLMQGASLDENGRSCDQWQAAREGEHPPCWTDGACWESNADLSPSLQVDAWRFVRPAHPTTGENGRTLVRAIQAPANGGQNGK
jgi:hypothetical protein